MAKCEKREITVEPPPVEYVLTLSLEEAIAVRNVLARECGATDDVWSALAEALAKR